jgi:hypothetical protein
MKALPVASFIAGTLAFCSSALAQCRVTDLKLEQAILRKSELIARWYLQKFRSSVCAVAQRLGALPSMVSLIKSERSRPGESIMNRTATLVAITLISAFATPVVVNATASKAGVAVAAAPVAAPQVAELTCASRIKVVYAGYGEAQATPCTVLVR